MSKLLVGYDGSVPAREAARVASVLARRLGADVTVLTVGHVITLVDAEVLPAVDEAAFLPTAEEGAEILRASGLQPEARAAFGEPAEALSDVAGNEGHSLIVVGHRGLSGLKGLIMGSVAKRLASHAPCPVLVVQGRITEEIRRVLVATDGSGHSRRAVEVAATIARACGAQVTLLHVLDLSAQVGVVHHRVERAELLSTQQEIGRAALTDAAKVCRDAGVDCDMVQADGRPADVICQRAEDGEYDLVAVGRRGMSGLARLVLGSVSDVVLEKAGRPVLLVGEQAAGSRSS